MALADNTGCAKPSEDFPFPEIIELNVGGQVYITRHPTLVSVPGSLLWEMFTQKNIRSLARDSKGRFFVDRDGFLFRYILDYMRDQQLVLPDHFPERSRLQREAEYFMLPELVKMLAPKLSKQNSLGDDPCQSDPEELSPQCGCHPHPDLCHDGRRAGFITIGYRGSYTLGRDSQTDAKFRRVARIMVCGKTSLAKEVFGDTLNESRDPDRPPERYTSRYYLKFTFLEQAFDKLADAGFHMVACNSTGTCAFAHDQTDDRIWTSYTEYVFYRDAHLCSWAAPCPIAEPQGLTQSPTGPRRVLERFPQGVQGKPPHPQLDPPPPPNPISIREGSSYKRKSPSLPAVLTNGVEVSPAMVVVSEERRAMETELGKCIEDFRKIKIPVAFPNKKRQWQSELLRKYQL
uniref:Uncharacterized protein n=1 Tax=Melopsittacus undulatus TaxID=13146 RepID=A0A8V5G6D2_MELUD